MDLTTFSPKASTLTLAIKSLTTGKDTSASNKAMRISRMASSMSFSVNTPRDVILEKTEPNLSVRASKIVLFLFYPYEPHRNRQGLSHKPLAFLPRVPRCSRNIYTETSAYILLHAGDGLSGHPLAFLPRVPRCSHNIHTETSAYILLHASVRTLADWRHSLECYMFLMLFTWKSCYVAVFIMGFVARVKLKMACFSDRFFCLFIKFDTLCHKNSFSLCFS